MLVTEQDPLELLKFPYPYQAAFTVASDIDSASLLRFRAVHALFCGTDPLQEDTPEWKALGLNSDCPGFDSDRRAVPGLGLDLADSFFLVGDATTFGMHRHNRELDRFQEDEQQGQNCATEVRQWLKQGKIDCFHAFLHYTRAQVEPLLQSFYGWCERENVVPPRVWLNHSAAVTPSGLCPETLQPRRLNRLARLTARKLVGPLFGRNPLPLRYAFVRYDGDTPGSPYYINDLLAAKGLRYVWLNVDDAHRNRIALPEHQQNGRSTILQSVTMDDGARYWRFERCYGHAPGAQDGGIYLRDSEAGCDSSYLLSESNLQELCRCQGTCILCTHWTHPRSVPIAPSTVARFALLSRWQAAGKVWVTSTSQLLEWTRLRTFLTLTGKREGKRLVVEIGSVEDPVFGREAPVLSALQGLAFRWRGAGEPLSVFLKGQSLNPDQVRRSGDVYWLDAHGSSPARPLPEHAATLSYASR